MTDYIEFAAKIKEKYPQYKDIDDLTLAQKVVEKYPQYKEQVTFEKVQETPKKAESKGIDLTPSGMVKKATSYPAAALRAALKGEDFNTALDNTNRIYNEFKPAKGLGDLAFDLGVYSKLPMLRTAGGAGKAAQLGRFAGNAAIQGGVPGALESLKREGDAATGAGVGTGIAAALQTIPYIGRGIGKVGGKALELTGRAGQIKPETLKQVIKPESTALEMTSDDAGNALIDVTKKVREGYGNLLKSAGEKVGAAIDNLPKTNGMPINELKYLLDDIYDSFSLSGDRATNRAYDQASELYDDIVSRLENAKIPQAKIDRDNFVNAYNKMINNEINPRKQVKILSETPEVWRINGVDNKNIITDQNVLKKMGSLPNKFNKNHYIDDEIIKNLPDLLQDPNYILKSDTHPDRLLGILDAMDGNNNPIAVALSPKTKGLGYDVNFVPSAYGKDNFTNFLNNQMSKGNLLYNKTGANFQHVPAPIAGGGNYTPKDIISSFPENLKMSNAKLRELIEHLDDYNIDWTKPKKADIEDTILRKLSGSLRSRISDLSPELKAANKAYADLKNFENNDGVKQILKGDLFKDGQLGGAPKALKSYKSSIDKTNGAANIQDLENLLVKKAGAKPFLNKIDDINAAMDLLKTETTGLGGVAGLTKAILTRPVLRAVRAANKAELPAKIQNIKDTLAPIAKLMPALGAKGAANLLYGGVEYNDYQ